MKFKFRNTFFITTAILVFLTQASCSSSQTEKTSNLQQTETSSDSSQSAIEILVEEAEPVTPEVNPILPVTVTDYAGNTVTINSVERIIPLDGSVAEVVFASLLYTSPITRDRQKYLITYSA